MQHLYMYYNLLLLKIPASAICLNWHTLFLAYSNAVAYLRGGGCDRPPDLTVIFKANFALFCRLHFATKPYKIRVQRHGHLYNSMLEASSDMSVFTITAGWLLLANFNRRTVANAVHRD